MNKKQKKARSSRIRKSLSDQKKKMKSALLIRNWDELRAIPQESTTHILVIEDYCGWIEPKDPSNRERHHYLSTHTFYGKTHKQSTKMLQQCGFNVIIDNWDKDYPERN